jgi:hypothetical protein
VKCAYCDGWEDLHKMHHTRPGHPTDEMLCPDCMEDPYVLDLIDYHAGGGQ